MIIKNLKFSDPYNIGANFKNLPGIYVIFTKFHWLDVGETEKLSDRINGHERKLDWLRKSNGQPIFLVFIHEISRLRRLLLEHYLRKELRPLCGVK